MRRKPTTRRARRGNVLVLTAFMMVALIAMLAFAIDLGYIAVARTELQRSADSAAMAAAWELIDDEWLTGAINLNDEVSRARQRAAEYAGRNSVCSSPPTVDLNEGNNPEGDIVIGYLADPSDRTAPLSFQDPNTYNTVRVRIRRTDSRNGEVPFFFARILGYDSAAADCEATAALLKSVRGFRPPADGTNLGILPFAIDEQTWDAMLAGGGSDNWSWDAVNQRVVAGPDGLREVNLYPQGTGSPGNRGTVDIGSNNNSTADIARQILQGVSKEDLSYLGGELKLDDNGERVLNGDTGISAGVQDELLEVRQQGGAKIIPVFRSVVNPGNNAQYTIVKFAGVRVMEVKLTGSMSSKRVIVQPANVVTRGAIPSEQQQSSYFIYSPVWLVR